MKLYTLTSDLHGEMAANAGNEVFIKEIEAELGQKFTVRGGDFSDYGQGDDIIYVRTGGTEGTFKSIFAGDGETSIPGGKEVRLLTSGQSNSLAASMEILSWLRSQDIPGRIIHGDVKQIVAALHDDSPAGTSGLISRLGRSRILEGKRFGIIGEPSDWLISSGVDYDKVEATLGAELVDIPIEELVELASFSWPKDGIDIKEPGIPRYGKKISAESFDKALDIYCALNSLVEDYGLDGLTLRCFDLLSSIGNTGCLALALLNSEGITATCEGDIPAMLSMAVCQAVTGQNGFQVNLSRIREGGMLFAHCTIPLNMVSDWCYDTHFESGIGVAIHGTVPEGAATLFKIGADMEHYIVSEGKLCGNSYENNLCRTQVTVDIPQLKDYLLQSPLGNHHIILTGAHADELVQALKQ